MSGFDAHRRGDISNRHCVDPATITKDGGMHLDSHGIWRWNGRSPHADARSASRREPQTAETGLAVGRYTPGPSKPAESRSGAPPPHGFGSLGHGYVEGECGDMCNNAECRLKLTHERCTPECTADVVWDETGPWHPDAPHLHDRSDP